jgi:hypothetical protein
VRDVIAAGIDRGRLTDAMGRVLPLQAAIVVMTARGITAAVAPAVLGSGLVAACDAVAETPGVPVATGDDAIGALLEPLVARFRRRGIEVTFDPAFVAWIGATAPASPAAADAFLDRDVVPSLVASLPDGARRVTAVIADGTPRLRAADPAP